MRLDKFLKVSRLIKRRTLAKEVCDRGQVSINGRVAKASAEVKPGDLLSIDFGRRRLKVEVLSVPEAIQAHLASQVFRIVGDYIRDDKQENK